MACSIRARLFPVVAALAAAGCAAGAEGLPTGAATGNPITGGGGASTGGTGSTTTSASGTTSGEGAGTGDGGGGSSQAGGGDGGQTQGGGGPGGAGPGGGGPGGGGQGGGAGGGPADPVITLLAVGASSALTAVRQDDRWSSDEIAGTFQASSRPALAMRADRAAIGLLRASSNTLLHTTWTGAAWLSPTPVGGATTTRATPAIASAGDGVAHATFHGDDFVHYWARYDGVFSPVDEPVGGAASSAFGPSAGSIAVVGGFPVVAYAGDDDDLHVQARNGGGWLADVDVDLTGGLAVDLTPAVIALEGEEGDALIVFSATSSTLHWTRRAAGVWSPPLPIEDALSTDPPSLAATEGAGAVVAFRGTNGGIYAAVFEGAAGSWSAPEPVVPVITTPSTPSVATGVGAATAELAYVDASGAVFHARLVGPSWEAPVPVGGRDLTGVAIASGLPW